MPDGDMQYILSQEEYDELKRHADAHRPDLTPKQLQKLCTEICDTMPVNWGWNGPDPKPWGCKLSKDHEWYCDKCPVQRLCPSDEQEFSK
jgi:hypothetical protein